MDAIGEEIRFRADVRVQSGEYKRVNIIAQPFRADVLRRTGLWAAVGGADAGSVLSRAFVVAMVCRSPVRNRRHVSEPCTESAGLVVTAGFAPNALLVSMSS